MQLRCEECHKNLVPAEAVYYLGACICRVCHNLHFEECACCGFLYDEEADAPRGAWGGMCIDCSSEHFVCDSCGEIYHVD